ncbi:MAG: TfoX/Sxy family protein [Planctomycetaceae bacterium]
MKNLGPKSREMLRQVKISTLEEIQELGAVTVYLKLQKKFPEVTLNLLWALEGAIQNCHWNELTPARKAELKAQLANDIQ